MNDRHIKIRRVIEDVRGDAERKTPTHEFVDRILALLEENLPTDEEIHIRIVNCMWGYTTVPELREWLKERFR